MSSCGSSPAGRQRHICLFGKWAWEIKIHFRSLCSDSQGPCWRPITLQFEQLRRPTGCFPHPIAAQGAGCSADRHTWARPASHCERFARLIVFVLAVRRTLMVGSLALEWQINLELHLAKNFGLGELICDQGPLSFPSNFSFLSHAFLKYNTSCKYSKWK